MRIESVIVVINPVKGHSLRTAKTLKEALDASHIRQEWVEAMPSHKGIYESLTDLRTKKADLIIACGGDGTVIQTAHRSKGTGIPILGINIGYLGFITSIQGNQVKSQLKRILNTEFIISQRTTLDVKVREGRKRVTSWAVNDLVVTRGDNPHVITVKASVGKRPLTTYRCDGIIVATPTGSTAYSLAAGGPIISPECNVLAITPICPHALTSRTVIVNCSEPLEIELNGKEGSGVIQVDGMEVLRIHSDAFIEVTASPDPVPLAFLPEINYYDVLNEKLKWTGHGITH